MEEEFKIFFQKKTLRKVNPHKTSGNEDQYSKALSEYFSILPLKLIATKERQIFRAKPFEERKKIYQQEKPTLDRLKKPFESMVISRNIIAKEKGYKDYVSFIKKGSGIPDKDFNCFLENTSQVIDYLYSNLPKVKNLPEWFYDPLNKPCLLCLVPFKELTVPEEVLNFVTKQYPELKLFHSKIYIIYKERSYTRYLKEDDAFEVSINKNVNKRHQMVILVHELGHVINFLESFNRGENILALGKYAAEKKAIKIELEILKLIDIKILKAYSLDLLMVLHRTLFELAVYENPEQNYNFLYAKLFNKCFPDAKQKSNPFYLLDEGIIAQPFSSLPQTVASVNILDAIYC